MEKMIKSEDRKIAAEVTVTLQFQMTTKNYIQIMNLYGFYYNSIDCPIYTPS